MPKFKVTVTQTNVFSIDKDEFAELDLEFTADQAKRIATDNRIWDENNWPETFSVNIDAEEV